MTTTKPLTADEAEKLARELMPTDQHMQMSLARVVDAAKLLPHKTIPVQVTVDVDEDIAEIVKYLQTVPGVRTHTSCAGGVTYAPYVMATYTKEARQYLLKCGFTFSQEGTEWGYIHPPLKQTQFVLPNEAFDKFTEILNNPPKSNETLKTLLQRPSVFDDPQPASPGGEPLSDAQIKHMVDRFLGWKLPENFSPDAGISFKPTFNDHLPTPTRHEPSGTNLFDYSQAEAMIRYMVEGMPGLAGRPKVEDDVARSLETIANGVARALEAAEFKLAEREAKLAVETDRSNALATEIAALRRDLEEMDRTKSTKLAETEAELAKARDSLVEAIGCFDAANAEGLTERLAEADMETGQIGDIIQRRILHAYPAMERALEVLDVARQQQQKASAGPRGERE